jgi:hypothetical protein
MSEKVIFLDIDGVLLPTRTVFLPHNLTKWPRDDANAVRRAFDPIAVAMIARLVELSGAKLVACTSWRHFPGRDVIARLMREAGWDPEPHWHQCWRTPFSRDRSRAEEILCWFEDEDDVQRWVSLDDNARPSPGGIGIDPHHGIRLEDYRTAALLLNVIDPRLGEADSWPLWTQWGEREAIGRWLDDAFMARRDFLQEVEAIPSELKWEEERELRDHAERHFRRSQSVQLVLDAADPWSVPEGPAGFLADPRSVETRSFAEPVKAGDASRRPGAPTGADGLWLPCIPPLGAEWDRVAEVYLDVERRVLSGTVGFSPATEFRGRDVEELMASFRQAADTYLSDLR